MAAVADVVWLLTGGQTQRVCSTRLPLDLLVGGQAADCESYNLAAEWRLSQYLTQRKAVFPAALDRCSSRQVAPNPGCDHGPGWGV